LERYFAERVLKNAPASQRRNALEDQILDEIFRLSFGATGLPAREVDKDEHQNVTERGIQFIEANLFSALSSREIAVYCRTSVASLFRVFKKDLGRTPFDYVRERRLDEAFQLLKGKRYSVSDVALLVGYEDLSAFSKAFKKKFRKNPSDVLKV
jgi:transcriptional regulator GlxA family with amidase domain